MGKKDCPTCEHEFNSGSEHCGSCMIGAASNWKEASWVKDEKIAKLEQEIAHLKQDSMIMQENIYQLKARKMPTEEGIAKVLLREECGMRWEGINDEEKEIWLGKAKSIVALWEEK